jgi:acyl-homoserine lactone acylase PvdQ
MSSYGGSCVLARSRVVVLAVVSSALAGLVATGAASSADTAPPAYVGDAGGFRSVLAYGEGQTVNALDLAQYEVTGTPPDSFTSQAGLYNAGVDPRNATDDNLDTFFHSSSFTPADAPGSSSESPKTGVTIARDGTYQVFRVYGDTRPDVMWGAGYAAAEDRLFLMDVLRRTAEGNLAELLGASAAAGDSQALGINDLSPAQLTAEAMALPTRLGAEGAQALDDIQQYVAGINAYIDAAQTDPTLLPAEYPALGATPAAWTLADSVAVAYLLIGQFTVSGGGEAPQAMILRALQKRLGAARGARIFADLRNLENPMTPTTTDQVFHSDNPAPDGHSAAMVDPGSFTPRNAVESESSGAPTGTTPTGGTANSGTTEATGTAISDPPAWAQKLARDGLRLPHEASNAVLVTAQHSTSGHPLAVMGPQIGYYSPEVVVEEELHAPGINVAGMSFPGAVPYPEIGHGLDFAWTGTTAMGDNQDTFAEKLCNPDGSTPTTKSTHYLYRGTCRAFGSRTFTEQTPVAPTSPEPPDTITMKTLHSVHGPVFAYGTVHGHPVALTNATGVYHHAVVGIVPFMRAAENRIDSVQSFVSSFRLFTGNENWFYIDSKDIGWIQSGWFPRHAPGTDLQFPIWGTGRYDWQQFRPSTYTYARLGGSHNPTAIDPASGYLVSWNNKAAPGWHSAPGVWVFGAVQRVSMLEDPLRSVINRKGRVTLADVAKVNLGAATTDLHGSKVLPTMLKVLGTPPAALQPAVAALRSWLADGAHRRDTTGNGWDDHSDAVMLMSAWWPRLVSAIFTPRLGKTLVDTIGADELAPLDARPTYTGYFNGWDGQVKADLLLALGRELPAGAPRDVFCGGGSLSRCRALLRSTLADSVKAVTAANGADMSAWHYPVTCDDPSQCDANFIVTAGAVETPPQPFENRGTYQQAVEIPQQIPR